MKTPKFTLLSAALLGLVLIPACGGDAASDGSTTGGNKPATQPTDPAPAPGSAAAEAKDIFKYTCGACHGVSGKGDGLAAAALNPKPRDYTDKAWQDSVTDAEIKKAILDGLPPNDGTPSTMVSQKAVFEGKPEGTVDEVIKIIRGFGKK